MRWFDSLLAGLTVLVINPATLAAPNPPEQPPASPRAAQPSTQKTARAVPVNPAALGGLDQLLPVGKSAEGVKLPTLSEEGRLLSVTRIEKVTRIDEENYGIEGLRIVSFDPERLDPQTGKPLSTTMEVLKGTYHGPTKTLKSDHPCKMTKPEFDLTGDSLVYQSAEGIGVMKGNVKMIIHPRAQSRQRPAP
jgi:hypothetical protein